MKFEKCVYISGFLKLGHIILCVIILLLGAVAGMQVLNNFSKKMSAKQISALKEWGTCLPEKLFKKKTHKLADKCKQVRQEC